MDVVSDEAFDEAFDEVLDEVSDEVFDEVLDVVVVEGLPQSPTRDGTALTPFPISTRCVPQLAAWAMWIFWLS